MDGWMPFKSNPWRIICDSILSNLPSSLKLSFLFAVRFWYLIVGHKVWIDQPNMAMIIIYLGVKLFFIYRYFV